VFIWVSVTVPEETSGSDWTATTCEPADWLRAEADWLRAAGDWAGATRITSGV